MSREIGSKVAEMIPFKGCREGVNIIMQYIYSDRHRVEIIGDYVYVEYKRGAKCKG